MRESRPRRSVHTPMVAFLSVGQRPCVAWREDLPCVVRGANGAAFASRALPQVRECRKLSRSPHGVTLLRADGQKHRHRSGDNTRMLCREQAGSRHLAATTLQKTHTISHSKSHSRMQPASCARVLRVYVCVCACCVCARVLPGVASICSAARTAAASGWRRPTSSHSRCCVERSPGCACSAPLSDSISISSNPMLANLES